MEGNYEGRKKTKWGGKKDEDCETEEEKEYVEEKGTKKGKIRSMWKMGTTIG